MTGRCGQNPPQVYSLQAGVREVIVGSFVNVPLLLDLVVIWQAVHFVNEHLEVDVGVDLVGPGHREMQPAQSLHIVILSRRRATPLKKKHVHQHSFSPTFWFKLHTFSRVKFIVMTEQCGQYCLSKVLCILLWNVKSMYLLLISVPALAQTLDGGWVVVSVSWFVNERRLYDVIVPSQQRVTLTWLLIVHISTTCQLEPRETGGGS